jgi:Tol biopolymer transport system component
MAGKALPQRKALDYALQIARGLAAAHEKGIVHRDMKPDNVFVTNDGLVKILDFGLAKLTGAFEAQSQTEVPTRRVNTDPGTVMGTMGYISPEQLKGLPVDHRSDIFSFGAILYEMLSGKRAFRGDSLAETISAILREDPPDLSETNKTISPALERIVRHCMEKNPAERFHSARDLAFGLDSVSGISGQSIGAIPAVTVPPKRNSWLLISATAVTIVALVAGAFFLGRKSSATTPPIYQQLTFRRGTIFNAKFAPDGQTIVYSAAWGGNPSEIFSSRLGSTEAHSLGLKNADVLSVSATGELAVLLNRHFLGQSVSRGTLARMPLDGGAPREILEDVQEADWSPDGTKLAIVRWVNGRNRLEYPIGKVLYETNGYLSWPRVSPKGDLVAFMEHGVKYDNRGWVAIVDLNGNKKTLTREWAGEEGLTWTANGDELWFGAGQAGPSALYAVTPVGRERVVARAPSNLQPFDIYRDGRVLLMRQDYRKDVIGLAPGETRERDLSWLDDVGVRDFSGDGKSFLFSSFTVGSGLNYTTYLGKTDGSPPINLGEGDGWALSPDGKWALTLFYTPSQLVLLPTGAGETKRLEIPGIETFGRLLNWFPDGKRILFNGKEPGHDWRMYVYDLNGGNPRAVTPEGVVGGLISPDGKAFIAADPLGKKYLYPIAGGDARPIPGLSEDDRESIAGWSADGYSLYLFRFAEVPFKISRLDLATGQRELFKEVVPIDPAGILDSSISLTPDGKGYLYQLGRNQTTLYVVEGLK